MEELFPDVPEYVRRQTDFWIDMAMREETLIGALNIIQKYMESLDDQENKDYVAFAFTTRMEAKHASVNDQR